MAEDGYHTGLLKFLGHGSLGEKMFGSFFLKFAGAICSVGGGLLTLIGIWATWDYGLHAFEGIAILVGTILFVYGRYLEYVSEHTVRVRDERKE